MTLLLVFLVKMDVQNAARVNNVIQKRVLYLVYRLIYFNFLGRFVLNSSSKKLLY